MGSTVATQLGAEQAALRIAGWRRARPVPIPVLAKPPFLIVGVAILVFARA